MKAMEYKTDTPNNLPYTNRSWLENVTKKIPFTAEINLIRNVPNIYK